MAALECVCREVTGDKKATLSSLIKSHPNIVPTLLNVAIEKIWGFSSEQERHFQEGRVPDYDEAELLVHLAATLCSYLCKKHIIVQYLKFRFHQPILEILCPVAGLALVYP